MILKNQKLLDLCTKINLPRMDFSDTKNLELIHKKSIELIQKQKGELTKIPPFEKHPYIENIDCEKITGLMIGTFPPISYLCDKLNYRHLTFNQQNRINRPDLAYFHGNYSSLWKYCPIDFDKIKELDRIEQPHQIKNTLLKQGIAYTDIISFCQRDLREDKNGRLKYTAEDRLLNNIVLNMDLFPFIFNCPNINRLYFTNASFFGSNSRNNHLFNKNGDYILKNRDAFRLFLKGANDSGYKIEMTTNENPESWFNINEGISENNLRKSLNELFTSKTILKLRLSKNSQSKIFQLYSAVSPAAVDRGSVRKNQCVINFLNENTIQEEDAPKELLKKVLLSFFQNSIDGLIKYQENS